MPASPSTRHVSVPTAYGQAPAGKKGATFEEIDVSGDWDARQRLAAKAGGSSTVPQIWIGDTHVGGCDDLYALDRTGKLDALLAE